MADNGIPLPDLMNTEIFRWRKFLTKEFGRKVFGYFSKHDILMCKRIFD